MNVKAKIEVRLDQLFLDPDNYRIQTDRLYSPVTPGHECDAEVQKRTFTIVVGYKQENITDLLDSFRSNGYLPVDQIQVRKINQDQYLVLEGNRRIATLKWMFQEYKEHGYDLGKFDPEFFEKIPVIVNDEADIQFQVLMGLKHISGNKKWGIYNQALLLYDMMVKSKISEDDICSKLGIYRQTFRQKFRAVCLVKQYQSSDYGDQFNEGMFPLFIEVMKQSKIKDWIGWNDNLKKAENSENIDILFSLISKVENDESGNADENEDNNRFRSTGPAIVKRDEMSHFAEFVNDTPALEKLVRDRDFQRAYANSSAVKTEQRHQSVETLRESLTDLHSYRFDGLDRVDLEKCFESLAEIVDANREAIEYQDRRTYDKSGFCHLTKMLISKYKCFSDINSFTDFARINIIAGSNNAGKTSLLEAIYLLIQQNNIFALRDIMNVRGKITDSHTKYEWFFQQISDIVLSGDTDDGNCSYKLNIIDDDIFTDDTSDAYLGSVRLTTKFLDKQRESKPRFFKDRIEFLNTGFSLGSIVFHSPFCFNEAYRYRRFYLKCEEIKKDKQIVEFMKNNIDSTIEKIYWDDEKKRFLMCTSSQDKAFDLCQMGEGFQRIYLVSLIFASAANGIILIDEFENAIHAGLLKVFSEMIYKLSHEFNVQVFITSHSKECIDSFARLAQQKEKDEFAFYAIASKDSNRAVKRFSGKNFLELLEFADVDLRRVRL